MSNKWQSTSTSCNHNGKYVWRTEGSNESGVIEVASMMRPVLNGPGRLFVSIPKYPLEIGESFICCNENNENAKRTTKTAVAPAVVTGFLPIVGSTK
jgi:hypothetical protein